MRDLTLNESELCAMRSKTKLRDKNAFSRLLYEMGGSKRPSRLQMPKWAPNAILAASSALWVAAAHFSCILRCRNVVRCQANAKRRLPPHKRASRWHCEGKSIAFGSPGIALACVCANVLREHNFTFREVSRTIKVCFTRQFSISLVALKRAVCCFCLVATRSELRQRASAA